MDFSTIANTQLHREKDVLSRLGFSRATLWRFVKDGSFPKPVKIGLKAVAWPSTSVDAWIQGKIEASQKGCMK